MKKELLPNEQGNVIINQEPFYRKPQAIIFLLVGVSGVGKTTLIKKVFKRTLSFRLGFLITCATRPPRSNEESGMEIDGVDYYFFSKEDFISLKDQNFFAEYEEVYPGSWYGTSFNELHRMSHEFDAGLTDIDVNGAIALKTLFPENIYTVFLQPQSIDDAKKQLIERSKKENASLEKINERINRFEYEMSKMHLFDFKITSVPNDPDHAFHCLLLKMTEEVNKRKPSPLS